MLIRHSKLSKGAFAMALIFGFSQLAWAAALVEQAVGELRVAKDGTESRVAQGARIDSGATLTTLSNSHAILRFDDGQVIVLNADTVFKVVDYRYDQTKPAEDRSILDLAKGAFRYVSGALAQRSREATEIRSSTATIGIRGTDFMAASGSLGISVGSGQVAVSNTAGSAVFGAGQTSYIAAANVLPVAGPLPGAIVTSFSQLAQIPVVGAPLPANPNPGPGYGGGNAATGTTTGSATTGSATTSTAATGTASTGTAAATGTAAGASASGVAVGTMATAATAAGVAAAAAAALAAAASGGESQNSVATTSTSTSTATSTQ
ncbi:FecR family protein [Propionivibrio dicarboxylicus]|uniref:FecR family protein n=2 Tax=Propionivibrio dicarboxylicus TaxID=83767 RepID=A0A1G7WHR2_9RHOO|nr:FecR family protein [Propionivibrio dicarboxylicus]